MKIIVHISGGIGNQLFMYAFGYGLSKRLGAELCLDTTYPDNQIGRAYELDAFALPQGRRLSYHKKPSLWARAVTNRLRFRKMIGLSTRIYKEKDAYSYEPAVNEAKTDTYFAGYWQSEKYFAHCARELREIFTPKDPRDSTAEALAEKMTQENSVAVHIRRGDYVGIGVTLDMCYYDTAIDMLRRQLQAPVFYIFSDDPDFCRDYFSKYSDLDIRFPQYSTENSTVGDLWLMSKCRHNIIANSSYSWWGAWLGTYAQKQVICPETGDWRGDFYPKAWTKVQCKTQ